MLVSRIASKWSANFELRHLSLQTESESSNTQPACIVQAHACQVMSKAKPHRAILLQCRLQIIFAAKFYKHTLQLATIPVSKHVSIPDLQAQFQMEFTRVAMYVKMGELSLIQFSLQSKLVSPGGL